MLQKDMQREKQNKAVIRGLRAVMGLSDPSPDSLTNPVARVLLGTDTMKEVLSDLQDSLGIPPQIVFIGKTGVGKSSTINELFDPIPNLPVDHIEPATIEIEVRDLSLGDRGRLIFVDCPGLGAGEAIDKRNIKAYKEVLASCDVAVWIIKADDRTLGIDQIFVKEVLPDRLKERLVIGINQIDKIEPGEWIKGANLPSKEQLLSIARKEEIVRKTFSNIGLSPHSVISYSAKKHYRLKMLFKAMLEACPEDRILALDQSKANIKSFYQEETSQSNFLNKVWHFLTSWFSRKKPKV